MDLQIRFCTAADGTRIGYAVLGEGPAVVVVNSVGNSIETEWENHVCRAALEHLARNRKVVVMMRRGIGPSQRDVDDLSLAAQTSDVAAVIDALGPEPVSIWGFFDSVGPCVAFAVEQPSRIRRLLLWDPYQTGAQISAENVTLSMIELMRENWRLATRAVANIVFPNGPVEDQRWHSMQWRKAFTPEMAGRYWRFMADLDITSYLPRLTVPTLVIHRRGDRAVPMTVARDVASAIPGARFLAFEGEIAYSWLGDISYLDAVEEFLDEDRELPMRPAEAPPDRLSAREVEVLKLLAQGKTNQDIAIALVISLNTVSHHVTNILNKIGLSNRTEAAAYAHRHGFTDATTSSR
jgi:DNA-binding CsgD family transcriptional regulator/pimeloyl-ACP methyl ester carboxylesterase